MSADRKNVAVLMGGSSTEREVSLRSGAAIAAALAECGHTVHEVIVGTDNQFHLPPGTQAAFIALHGAFGEDGGIQRELEARGMPYTGSRPAACEHAFDKIRSKRTFAESGIPTAPFAILTRGELQTGAPPPLPLPLVVKSARQGSSRGVWRIFTQADWPDALAAAIEIGDDVVVETYIPGRELTVGIVNGIVLPVLEIFAPDGNYDYHAKYTTGASTHAPAKLPAPIESRCQGITRRVAELLDCPALGRVDFRFTGSKLYVLELNNIPGFTEMSLLPDAAKAHGWTFPQLCDRILSAAH